MKFNPGIHSKSHLLKALFGRLSALFPGPSNQLIVLNYHGTQKKFLTNFISQINYLKQHYDIISPVEFKHIAESGIPVKGKKVLLTFDDGIKNNQYAIDVLNDLKLSALFFVVPGFIDAPKEEQKNYFIKNIRPYIQDQIDSMPEDFEALSWDDLKKITSTHAIGCHTYSHTMVKDQLNESDLNRELLKSKQYIEEKLSVTVDTFCSINNTLLTVGCKERQLIEQNYGYHFTTFGGNNIPCRQYLVKRINVESHWLQGAFKFALSSFELNRWTKKINQYLQFSA